MKIKVFKGNIEMCSTANIEKEVNTFLQTHDVISITPACTGKYLTITVVYKEELK